ncbi:MAG: ATP-dependent helicase [Bacteriovoracaceae bacterium]|nr:ATP-dependent helicase [Bacteriovoracaceae bacterium]
MTNFSKDFQARWFSKLDPNKVKILLESYLNGLSEEQADAAMHFEGPLLVIAGPGSGKTETMVRRTAILIDHYKVEPACILLTTFTEKAAANLVSRVKSRIADPLLVEQITIGTIHGICLKILEDFGVQRGLFTRSLRVLDEHKLSLFLFKNFEALGLKQFYEKPSASSISAMSSYYSSFQEKGTDVEALKAQMAGLDEVDLDLKAAMDTYATYLKLLDENQALDFSSILSRTFQLLTSDNDVLNEVRKKYKHIIVDEYQDTNPLQDQILRLISEPQNNVVVIGDDDQSLYRFRGATVTNFLEFSKRVPNCKVTKLSENRRSTPQILEVSRLVVDRIPEEGRTKKDLITNNPKGQAVTITSFKTDDDEVSGIAETISELYNSGKIKNYSDVAILSYSLSSIFGPLKEQLDARGIPFIAKGDKSFSGEIAVTQIVELMNFVTRKKGNIKDLNSFKPPVFRFLSDKTVDEISGLSFEIDVIEAITDIESLKVKSPHDRKRIFEMIELRRKIVGSNYHKNSYTDLVDMFFQILTITETIKFFSLETNADEADSVLDQLGKFSQLLSDYSNETMKRSFSDFRDFFTYIIRNTLDSPANKNQEDAVVIQTIHQSKGLEYPVIFMPGLVDSRFPSKRADDSSSIPYYTGVHKFWTHYSKHENVDTDFRRVLYVGVTRAEKLLYLSYFNKKSRKFEASRYLKELIESKKVKVVEDCEVPSSVITSKARNNKEKLRISSSHLQYYLFCPTRFKFALKHNLSAPHRGYFSFGSNLHSAIEEISNLVRTQGRGILEKIDPNIIFERHWNNFGFDSKGAEERQKEHARRYFSSFVKNQGDLLETITVSEKKFTLEESNFILTGKIDAIASPGKNELVVIDFKTGKKEKFDKEPDSTFVSHQANIYIEAVERTTGETPKGFYLHFLGEDQQKPDDFKRDFAVDKQSRGKVLSLLGETVDRIQKRDFAPIQEEERVSRCGLCEYREVCAFRLKARAA